LNPSSNSRFDFDGLAAAYDAWYETDTGRRHDAAQQEIVLTLLPTPTAGKRNLLLDVGCGTGRWSVFFAKQGFEVTGIDIAPQMISTGRARNALHCRFEVADAMRLPFPNGTFDMVAAMATLEFLSDASRACTEMMRCLKRGGWLLIGTLNRLARINRERIAARSEPYVSAHMFTPEELRDLLASFGETNILATAEHESGLGDESGAFIVAVTKKP